MSVKLKVVSGSTRTRAIEVRGEKAIVGRGRGCQVRIPSGEVSRRHCVLRVKDGKLTIEDLGSFNGTFLNGKKITGTRLVKPGDKLQIGPITFKADYPLAGAAKASSEDGFSLAELADQPETMAYESAEEIPEVAEVHAEEEEEEVVLELDAADSVNLPEGEDLGDLLSGLEE